MKNERNDFVIWITIGKIPIFVNYNENFLDKNLVLLEISVKPVLLLLIHLNTLVF